MAKMTLSVPDISCDHCKESIEGALTVIDGVSAVAVHVPEKTVDISFDESKIRPDAIFKIIEDQGYTLGN